MNKLRSIFGSSKDNIWAQIATDIGGEFIEGGFCSTDVLIYKHGEWQILLDTYTDIVSTGATTTSTTYTRMRAPFINKDGLYFKISRQGFLSSIGKFFGMQDIEIGDPFFDKQFVTKSNNPEKIKLLLANSRIKELCQSQPRIHLSIKDDEGWFGPDFPEGVDELYFERAGVIEETAQLKTLFGLFCLILERLVQIDSAYADDPQITLK
ncbi:MAG: DUF3137 domain-containing protein [Candidatus Poribacteria bacterium]|nr:DUF3137 domain-containing protein [Candidatus Poribacteria bacterium]MDD9975712.1 DUF3137 domain-containing protein [Candidatus Poribacteria bacterium]